MNRKPISRTLIAVFAAVLVLLASALALVYINFREQPAAGSKSITIEVVDNQAARVTYSLTTDAQFLLQAMEEAEGLTFSGEEGPYGMMIHTVNGVTADYNADASYWSFSVNGEYCNYGVSEQPVSDGDAFAITYTR